MKTRYALFGTLLPNTILVLCLWVALYPDILSAQTGQDPQNALGALAAQSATPVKVSVDEPSGTVTWLTGSFTPAVPGNPVESAYAFLESHRNMFQVQNPREEFTLRSVKKGLLRPTDHVYLDQKINGIPVWNRRLGFHYDEQGRLYAVNGKYSNLAKQKTMAIQAVLTPEQAFQRAWADVQRVPLQGKSANSKPMQLDADLPHQEKLMYFADSQENLRLCFRIDLCVLNPAGAWIYFVDAATGAVLHKFNNAQTSGPAVGSGRDLYNSTIALNTYLDTDGKYKLIDTSKNMYNSHSTNHPMTTWQGCIEVRDAEHQDADASGMPPATEHSPVVDDPDGDNVFTSSSTDPKDNLQPAVQLAAYLSTVYDFYQAMCGRNSLDNKGLSMVGNMHWGKKFSNSMWYPPTQQMYFGDGGDDYWPETRSLDTVAHEATHGVTQFEIQGEGYTYMLEAGAINESHSDIGAICNDYDEWLYGEEYHMDGSPSRRFDDPTAVANPQPKDMYDFMIMPLQVDGGGNHYNSGIGNHFFYQLGTRLPTVSPATDGRFTAFRIVYRSYIYGASTPYSTFANWGQYIKQAAVDLYGPGDIYNKVVEALDYVHIPQALLGGHDNWQLKVDDVGQPYFFTINIGFPSCWPVVSTRFTRPRADAKIKTVAINFENLGASTFKIWYCGSKADGSPDESGAQCLFSDISSSVIRTDGVFNNFKLTNSITAASEFHIALDMTSGTYGGIRHDTGDPATERSWFKYMTWNYTYGRWDSTWYKIKEYYQLYSLTFDPTLMIKVIYETSPSNAPCAPTLVSPADGATIDSSTVTFCWNAVSGADRYFLEANSSSDWSESTRVYFAATTATSIDVSGFPVGPNYWRVWAGNADAWSSASAARSFTETAPPPQLACSVASLAPTTTVGHNAASQSFEVWNCGSGSLTYSISDNAGWLSASPTNGSSSGAHDTITVSYNSSSLAEGTHTATITISASGAYGSPTTIPVTLTINRLIPVAGDLDGDRKADPAMYAAGNWYIWASSGGYGQSGPYALGAGGTIPAAVDFDGDGKADPATADSSGNWYIWLSSYGYTRGGPYAFGESGCTPLAADFDGDRKADPAGVDCSGNWYIWMSGYGYLRGGPYALGDAGLTPRAGDFDGDGGADPAAVDSSGNWYIYFSSYGYMRGGPYALGASGCTPLAADFDGDGKADPAAVDSSGNWYIWMSGY
ncbi:MAG: M4 family metallopeptidase, partial [Verrucomicrobia bacterium]|nr:M4 family metallopeptidase [Verrucomicrobiota bacterium]